jgi:PAS domain S-box-containing protein
MEKREAPAAGEAPSKEAKERKGHEIPTPFEAIFNGALDAILICDDDRRFVDANPAACLILGCKKAEMIGRKIDDFLDANVQPQSGLQWQRILSQGEVKGDLWLKSSNGETREVTYTAKANFIPGRHLIILHDITEYKRAGEALVLEITNVLLSDLDIRMVLSAISASIRRVIPHDYAALTLYDPTCGKLRLQNLDEPFDQRLTPAGMLVPIENSPAGWAFSRREPLVLNRLDSDRFLPEIMERLTGMGLKSACWFPLMAHECVLGTLDIGVRREGAFTEKTVHLLAQAANQVAIGINNARAYCEITELKDKLAEEKRYLEAELKNQNNFDDIICESAAFKRSLQQAYTVAPTDATVLITGETGTGKEVVARTIHRLSSRREHTFVKMNCAAIPTGLLESELFGHEKGAFTGALARKIGRLELAHEGTLFLDEVGDIPLEVQPKLLRVLQEKEFERLGSTKTLSIDVRLIAATNRNLTQMVSDGSFRSDLYYRLNVFPIVVPPLRERQEDIPPLVQHFVKKYESRMNKQIRNVPVGTIEALKHWHWPGNVRELENFIERAIILSDSSVLAAPLGELTTSEKNRISTPVTLEDAERRHILQALREAGGMIGGPQGAAARLGIKRTTLNGIMKRLGISRKDA